MFGAHGKSGIVDDNLKLSRSRSIAERRQADATRENRVKRILMMVFLVGVSIACFWQAIADVFTPPRPPHKAARRIQRILTVPRLVVPPPASAAAPRYAAAEFVRSRWRNKSVDNEHRSNCSTHVRASAEQEAHCARMPVISNAALLIKLGTGRSECKTAAPNRASAPITASAGCPCRRYRQYCRRSPQLRRSRPQYVRRRRSAHRTIHPHIVFILIVTFVLSRQ